jgi:hypothetical protein
LRYRKGHNLISLWFTTLVFALLIIGEASAAYPCSCTWRGPFFVMAPQSELVILGRILGYYGEERGVKLAMDVEVIEIFQGKTDQRHIRVWGDNGMLCRPYVTQFPTGTEWVLALNSPGSKPGYSDGYAISICGTFYLQLDGGQVLGNIDNEKDRKTYQAWPLDKFRRCYGERVRHRSAGAVAGQSGRKSISFIGKIDSGHTYSRPFGSGFRFWLKPNPYGWSITITDERETEDLSRLTPPLHFTPNPRNIEGWHFRNADNTGPNEAGDKNVMAPGEVRSFIFSPAVGRTIDGPLAEGSPTGMDIDRIGLFGRGELRILDYALEDIIAGKQARFAWMRFEVDLSWEALFETVTDSAKPPQGDH